MGELSNVSNVISEFPSGREEIAPNSLHLLPCSILRPKLPEELWAQHLHEEFCPMGHLHGVAPGSELTLSAPFNASRQRQDPFILHVAVLGVGRGWRQISYLS